MALGLIKNRNKKGNLSRTHHRQIQQISTASKTNHSNKVVNTKLNLNVSAMCFYGILTNTQLPGDLAIGLTLH